MATMQQQARALGDPTRHAIFRYLSEAGAPVGVAELTQHFGFNHNAIRQHLAKLLAAEMVIEEKATATGPGRPPLVYSVDPAADGRWGAVGPYENLSVLLTEVIRSGDSPKDVGRRAGREVVSAAGADDVERVRDAMARQGFDPEVRERRDGVDIVLRNCPFASAALHDPSTVCDLHLGIAEGVLGDNESLVVDGLIAKDPRRASCCLRLRSSGSPDA